MASRMFLSRSLARLGMFREAGAGGGRRKCKEALEKEPLEVKELRNLFIVTGIRNPSLRACSPLPCVFLHYMK